MNYKFIKITLVAPRCDHGWESLGLGYIASYSYKFGFSPEQYSFFNSQFDTDEEIVSGCTESDVVGFSLTTFQIAHTLKLIREIRAINPKVKIVWGGYAVNGFTAQELIGRYGNEVDYFIQGPGEESWVELLRLENPPRVMRKGLIDNLDDIPFPDRSLIRVDRHFDKLVRMGEGRKTSMEMQRGGCPFNCIFCAAQSFSSHRGQSRSAENIVAEMELLRDHYGMDHDSMVLMCDAEIFVNDEMGRMAELKMERHVDFKFGMNVVASTILSANARKNLEKMVAAGCSEVWMGVESSPSLLHLTGKPNTKQQICDAFKLTKEMGLIRRAYFILGFTEEENEQTILERIPFIEELDPDVVGFTIFIPVPGSPAYNKRIHQQINYDSCCEYHNTFTRTRTLSNADLQYWQQYLVNYFKNRITYRQKDKSVTAPQLKISPGRSGL